MVKKVGTDLSVPTSNAYYIFLEHGGTDGKKI
nr:MAG TPA_asm: hypothetical protein [Caudoviricetes sp.]